MASTRGETLAAARHTRGRARYRKEQTRAELFRELEALPELIYWRQGRSLPYGEGASFWALGEMVKGTQASWRATPPTRPPRSSTRAVAETVTDSDDAEWVVSHLRPLVGLETDAEWVEHRRTEAFAAWRRLFEAMSERRPLVLVFEDLHWADDALLDFIDYLVDWARGVPLLAVCTTRPELLTRRPGWGGGKANATTISLSALCREETAQLRPALLEHPVLAAGTQQELLAAPAGNPLYAEQYARMLAEHRAIAELPLPESVQGIIAARLDALPSPGEGAAAERLRRRQGLLDRCTAAIAGSYRVETNSSTHSSERSSSVASAAPPLPARASISSSTCLCETSPTRRSLEHSERKSIVSRPSGSPPFRLDRAEDRAEMLAHHYREALRLAEASGADAEPLREPARRAFTQAAERAYGLSAYVAAIELGREALALTPEDAAERAPLQLLIGYATWPVSRDDPGLIESARDGFLAQGDLARAAEASALLSRVLFNRGDADASRRAGAEAVDLARKAPRSSSTGQALAQEARGLSLVDRKSEAALSLAREALAIAEDVGDVALASHVWNTIGVTRVDLGDPDGIADLEHSVKIAEEAGRSLRGQFRAEQPREFPDHPGQALRRAGHPHAHGDLPEATRTYGRSYVERRRTRGASRHGRRPRWRLRVGGAIFFAPRG